MKMAVEWKVTYTSSLLIHVVDLFILAGLPTPYCIVNRYFDMSVLLGFNIEINFSHFKCRIRTFLATAQATRASQRHPYDKAYLRKCIYVGSTDKFRGYIPHSTKTTRHN